MGTNYDFNEKAVVAAVYAKLAEAAERLDAAQADIDRKQAELGTTTHPRLDEMHRQYRLIEAQYVMLLDISNAR